jgi:AP-1 complex subunit beta-1
MSMFGLNNLNLEATFKKVANQLKRAGGGARFFNAQGKRGESVELHQDLNSSDRERQKNALKRIIANMTLGKDVSQLFADVVKLGQTPNLEVKKLVYLYVLSNAKLQPDKALMAVNTFLQDATHNSPIVRALALRTMLCLRVDAVAEYTIPPLVAAITTVGEADAYVRKTAAIGVGKIYHQNPTLFEQHGWRPHLTKWQNDPFPVVSSNAAAVLAEIVTQPNFGPFEMQKVWVSKLLNALADAIEWGQVYILEALALYRAPIEEVENLTERVLPRLNHFNPAVVLAAVKTMATFVQRMPGPARQPYITRINAALLTLAKSDPETQYIVCRNAHMLLHVFPELLCDNFESFYIRFSDPPYVKFEKLRLLLRLVTPASANSVVKELFEYSSEVDPTFLAEVVRAAAVVGIKVESAAERCAELIKHLAAHSELLPVAVVAAKDMLRRYPNLVIDLLPPLVEAGADCLAHEDAQVAFVWMLGEFSDVIENGASLVDELVANFTQHELPVQRALLTAVIKLFLRTPAHIEKLLWAVLDSAMRGSSNPDLRDRALFYYRLLSRGIGVEKMSAIVLERKPADIDRAHAVSMTTNEIVRNLNTVAAVYALPPRKFLLPYGASAAAVADEDDDELEGPEETSGDAAASRPPAAQPAHAAGAPTVAAPPMQQKHRDVMDDLFAGPSAPTATVAPAPPLLAATTAPAPKGNAFDDMFGAPPAAAPKPAAPAPASGSLPREVLSAAANQGVGVYAEFVSGTSGPVSLALGLSNQRGTPIASVQLQLNRNRFALAPSDNVHLNGPIAPNATWSTIVPIAHTNGHHAATTGFSIQCGIALDGRVVTFAADLPPKLLLTYSPDTSKNDFARQWQGMDESSERKFRVPANQVESLLGQGRFAIVAKVGAGAAERVFAVCKTHTGVVVLIEAVISSGDVTLRAPGIADVADVVQRALSGATATAPAAKAALSVDDLFA